MYSYAASVLGEPPGWDHDTGAAIDQ
jgi:hypothetical protein